MQAPPRCGRRPAEAAQELSCSGCSSASQQPLVLSSLQLTSTCPESSPHVGPSRVKWPTGVRETHFTGPVPFSTGPVTGVAHCAGRSARSRRPSGQAKVDPPSETPPPASPRSRGAKRAPSLSALRRLTCPRAPFTCLPHPGAPAPPPQADLRGPEPPRRRTPGRRRARCLLRPALLPQQRFFRGSVPARS